MTEPLAVEFANTRYAVRGREREGVGTAPELSRWLHENGLLTDAGESDVPTFLGLRDAIRSLLSATAEGEPLPDAGRAIVNEASGLDPRWPLLTADRDVIEVGAAPPLPAARAAIAQSAVAVLGGPQREDVRACHAPGCVLFFVKDHPRREWCSAGCGNRARAARHYAKLTAPKRSLTGD